MSQKPRKPCPKNFHVNHPTQPLSLFARPHSIEGQLPLCIHTVGSNTPLLINALIDSGATGQFIDIDYVRSKNLCTQHLPRAIPVYNVDGTLNDGGYITEVINLMVHYGDHSE